MHQRKNEAPLPVGLRSLVLRCCRRYSVPHSSHWRNPGGLERLQCKPQSRRTHRVFFLSKKLKVKTYTHFFRTNYLKLDHDHFCSTGKASSPPQEKVRLLCSVTGKYIRVPGRVRVRVVIASMALEELTTTVSKMTFNLFGSESEKKVRGYGKFAQFADASAAHLGHIRSIVDHGGRRDVAPYVHQDIIEDHNTITRSTGST